MSSCTDPERFYDELVLCIGGEEVEAVLLEGDYVPEDKYGELLSWDEAADVIQEQVSELGYKLPWYLESLYVWTKEHVILMVTTPGGLDEMYIRFEKVPRNPKTAWVCLTSDVFCYPS